MRRQLVRLRHDRMDVLLVVCLALLAPSQVLGEVEHFPVDWCGYVFDYYDHSGIRHFWEELLRKISWYDMTGGDCRGAARCDISALPSGVPVLGATFVFNQYTLDSNRLLITYVADSMPAMSAEQKFTAIGLGPTISNDVNPIGFGWASRNLTSHGVSLVDSLREQGWVHLGIIGLSPFSTAAHGYNAPESLRPYLKVWYGYCPDLALLDARVETWPLAADDDELIRLRIANLGTAASAPSKLRIYAISGNVPRNDSLELAALAPGETTAVDYYYRPLGTGPLGFRAWLSVSDTLEYNHVNDSLGGVPWAGNWVYPPGTYAAEGFNHASAFPPEGWACVSADSGRRCWQRSYVYQSAPFGAICLDEPGVVANDDWIITGPLYPEAGWADTAGFFYRGYATGRQENLRVQPLLSQNLRDTLPCIGSAFYFQNLLWNERKVSLDAYDGQPIYLAVRYRSTTGNAAMLDDFWFSRLTEYGVEEEPAEAALGHVDLSPNPTRGRVNIACRELGRWRLLDVAGRVVAEGRGSRGDIDLSRQRPGVYCLEAVTESGTSRTKLVRAE